MRATLLILALVALLLPAPAGAQIRLPSIKNKLIELALDQVSSPGSFEITAGEIEDLEGGVTSLADVQVSDNEGVWLTLERLNFAWQPDALLSGELAITRLELIGITVSRPPSETAEPPELKPQEPSGRGIFDWPRAPIALSIKGVRLERVQIAEGVLPQAIAFDAEGRAFDKGDLQELALSLRRTDAVAGSIDLSMQRDFGANTVRLTVDASEAPGGIVAAAAGFPADAPARLLLNADGPPEDWRLVFDAGVERVFAAEGRATLAYADRLSVDADLAITPGPELDEQARTVLGDRARLTAKVTEREDGRFEVLAGELTSPALTLTASGAFAAGAGESDLAVSLVALSPLAALADGVAFDRFGFDGRITGPQGGLAAEGRMALAALATAPVDAGSLALDGRVAQTPGGWRFDLDGRGEALRLDQVEASVIGPAALSVAGTLEGDLLTLGLASLESRALATTASGRYDLAAAAGEVAVELSVPQIEPLAAPYGAAVSGSVDGTAELTLAGERVEAAFSTALTRLAMDPAAAERLTLSGRVIQDASRFAFDLAADGEEIVLDQVPRDLTRALRVIATGQMADGALALDSLSLTAPLATAEASGTVELEAETLAIDYALSTAELAPLAAAYGIAAAGALDAGGRAEGPYAGLRLTGRASVAEVSYEGQSYGAVAVEHDVILGVAPKGAMSLSVSGGALGPAEAQTQLRFVAPALTLQDLTARLLGVEASGAAVIDLDTSLVDGTFDFASADLAPLGRFAGLDLGGAARGQLRLTRVDGRQDVAAEVALTRLTANGVTAAEASLTLAAADALGTPRLDARLQAGGPAAGEVDLASLRAEAAGPLGGEPLSAALAGETDATGAVAAVTLARAEATVGPDTARLRQPLKLTIGNGAVEATGLDLALPGDASLTGTVVQRPGGYAGDLTLAGLPVEPMQRRAGMPFGGGTLGARAVLDTRPGRAGAELSARVHRLRVNPDQGDAGEAELDLAAGWDGARLDAKATLSGDFGDPLRAGLTVPLRPGRDGIPTIPPGAALDGRLAWAGEIGYLWALVPAPGHILDGRADIDLRLGGSLDAPRLSGRAALTDGTYQNLFSGTILTDLTLRTTVAEDGTLRLSLAGSDGAKGTLEATAALALGAAEPRVDAGARIDRATLIRRDDVTAMVSGEAAVAGPLSDLLLTGRIHIDKAEVRLIGAAPPELVDLDGIRIKGAPEPEDQGSAESRVTLDLAIVAERDIFVRGRGLDSEWKMDLGVTGDAAAPVVTGGIEKVRGVMDLLGRQFDLARGQVVFDGGREADPALDVMLEREENDIRGGITVSGCASAPELHFVSTPALPEDEVLPRLLFGRSRQSLSGSEALQLVAGLATLTSGKAGPLDSLRNAAGVDVLRVEGETAETATVTVGRNVAEGVFVGARQGLGGQGGAVAVEVFDGVIFDTEFGQKSGADIGITLRKDF